MTFTPGPWVQFADEGNTVAIMPAGRSGDVCKFAEPYPSKADVALMVLAPELLKALIVTTAVLERIGDMRTHKEGQYVAAGRDLIEAATGDSEHLREEVMTEAALIDRLHTQTDGLLDRIDVLEAKMNGELTALRSIAEAVSNDILHHDGVLSTETIDELCRHRYPDKGDKSSNPAEPR